MSRAEPLATRGSGEPGLRSALRAAAFDFYYQSTRLVPANIAWGLVLLLVLVVSLGGGPLATLAAAPLLAIPYAGCVRLAAQAVRGRDVVLSDLPRAYRRYGLVALAIGAGVTVAGALLASNVVVGAVTGGAIGWGFGTLAVSGLLAIWVASFPVWVVLVDPAREDRPIRDRLRLAILLVVAAPGRCTLLALVLLAILVLSTIAFAAVLTISISYAGLVAARYLLPLADRLEAWLEQRAAGTDGGGRPG